MKEITVTQSKRILPTTPEEKIVRESWKHWWEWFGRQEKTNGGFLIIFGDWSGYRSSQQQITHVDKSPVKTEGRIGTVQFTDNTTMAVWTEKLTRADLLRRKLRKRQNYDGLINDLIKSGTSYYKV